MITQDQIAALQLNDRVVKTSSGRTYVVTLVKLGYVWVHPINSKTGKPWQAGLCISLASDRWTVAP